MYTFYDKSNKQLNQNKIYHTKLTYVICCRYKHLVIIDYVKNIHRE